MKVDLDYFWIKAKKEVEKLELNVELQEAGFQCHWASCYDLFYTGVKEARIHVKYIKPNNLHKPHGALLFFHGYSGDSGPWTNLLPYVGAGYSVLAMDVRGQGGLSQDTGNVSGNTWTGHIIRGLQDGEESLLFRSIYMDTLALVRVCKELPEVDEEELIALGASQGGGLALACTALSGQIKRVAALYPFLCDFKRNWLNKDEASAYDELRYFFKKHDPLHEKEALYFSRLAYIDLINLVPYINCQTLMGISMRDTVCSPGSQLACYDALGGDKRKLVYPDYGHELIPHFIDQAYKFLTHTEEVKSLPLM